MGQNSQRNPSSRHYYSPPSSVSSDGSTPDHIEYHLAHCVPLGGDPEQVRSELIIGKTTALETVQRILVGTEISLSNSLLQALSRLPTLRQVEWNSSSRKGLSFKPRMSDGQGSLMMYVSGQVNPNPCHLCLSGKGPYARCITAHPSVLDKISYEYRDACANCICQNRVSQCRTIPDQHMSRSRTLQGISQDEYFDKLHQVRSMSPKSRHQIQTEIMQWQTAIMAVGLENDKESSSGRT
ncbi:hypothetical protein F4820DRAFT_370290 [Hypoxylon rubiginosum]|uniref:Uncharacterized protein n=1 Tax=Hypoxylon rubiginosum TaxID=110542 RepID=A0ACB9YWR4_9PEZI|nr:hypothetical protein F4820DRAFT_370290 [Hypoxylon rubiginosum]